jgi:hypothetical protein
MFSNLEKVTSMTTSWIAAEETAMQPHASKLCYLVLYQYRDHCLQSMIMSKRRDTFYIQWFVNLFLNLYLDLLEFEIKEQEQEQDLFRNSSPPHFAISVY